MKIYIGVWQITRKELSIFFKNFWGRLLDVCFMATTNLIVYGYFMSHMGLKGSYGFFILLGAIASFGFFETLGKATGLSQDVTDKKISNLLILPMPSYTVFVAIALAWAIGGSILTLCLAPLGKLILWDRFDLSHFCLWRFAIIFVTGNLFYGFFALWLSSMLTNIRHSSWLWCRVLNPLFMFCGYFYTWKAVYALSAWLGYLHLINPLIYILEGTKAAVLGQEGFLPFWVCVLVVWGFMALFAWAGIFRFKRRIDFV